MSNLRVFLITASGGMVGGLVTGNWDVAASWVAACIVYLVLTEAARDE